MLPVFVASQALVNAHMHRTKIANLVVCILIQDGGVIIESFQDVKEDDGKDATNDRANPVDPFYS